jgi:hypothetical protein
VHHDQQLVARGDAGLGARDARLEQLRQVAPAAAAGGGGGRAAVVQREAEVGEGPDLAEVNVKRPGPARRAPVGARVAVDRVRRRPAAPALSDRMRGRSQQLPRRDNSLICTGYEKCQLAVTAITANAGNPAPGFSSKCCAAGGYFWHSERQRYLREASHAAH